jgi:hypothetical protein
LTKRIIALLLIATSTAHSQEVFRYPVSHVRLLRDQSGELQIDTTAVSYRSENGETTIRIPLRDIRKADVSEPGVIRIETYDILKRRLGDKRVYTFRLTEGTQDEALGRFLANNLTRPVIAAYELPVRGSFEIPAYHKHFLGGCHGKVLIGDAGLQFLSDKPGESRTWLYRDVEIFGSVDPFHLRVSTLAETYNLELKERIPEHAHDKVRRSIYRPLENVATY